MTHITQEQANKLHELMKVAVMGFIIIKDGRYELNPSWHDEKNKLLAEIEANKPTNGDKWRSMTDEQIAEIIQADGCATCPASEICEQETAKLGSVTEMAFNKVCKRAIVKWLKQEAKQ